MAENTKIEWATHTFNCWWGCTKIAAGCVNCYAETWAKRFGVEWGPHGIRRKTSEAVWKAPLKWHIAAQENRCAECTYENNARKLIIAQCATCRAKRPRVFCASMADVFEDWQGDVLDHKKRRLWIPRYGGQHLHESAGWDYSGCRPLTLDDLRADVISLIHATPFLDWLVLTKRPENVRRMIVKHMLEPVIGHVRQNEGDGYQIKRLENLWLGTSIATQEDAERNIPELLKCRDLASVLFVSAEPLLGPVHLCRCQAAGKTPRLKGEFEHGIICPLGAAGLSWVIVGGESGHSARPMHPDWARGLRDQCQAAGVPFFFKQWGECLPTTTFYKNLAPEMVVPMSDGFYPQPSGNPAIVRVPGHGTTISGMLYVRCGKKEAGRLLDGREWNEFPTANAARQENAP